jgi:RHS repeat-associated protein
VRAVESQYDWFEARGYDNRVGRFLSPDPHAESYAGLSPYSYAGNSPLAFVDPSGKDSTSFTKAAEKALLAFTVSFANPFLGPEDIPGIIIGGVALWHLGEGIVDLLNENTSNTEAAAGDVKSGGDQVVEKVKEGAGDAKTTHGETEGSRHE